MLANDCLQAGYLWLTAYAPLSEQLFDSGDTAGPLNGVEKAITCNTYCTYILYTYCMF